MKGTIGIERSNKELLIINRDTLMAYTVKNICMCDECRKRGMPELEVVDYNGNTDFITLEALFDSEYILLKG